MNTYNGSLDVRIEGDRVYVKVDDCDLPSRATAELSAEQVKSLRAMLEEALVGVEYGYLHKTPTRAWQ